MRKSPLKGSFPYDQLLKMYTGKNGLWQIRTFLIIALAKVLGAWQMASILYMNLQPRVLWCGNAGHSPNFTLLIMKDGFDLVCGKLFLTKVAQFVYLFGMLMATIVAPNLINRYGPRMITLCGAISVIVASVAMAVSEVFEVWLALRFAVAFSCSLLVSSGFGLCMDVVSREKKVIFTCLYENFWSVGLVILPYVAYLLPGWEGFQIALAAPAVVILILYRWIPESPRWLLERGKFCQAKVLLERAAKMNGKDVSKMHMQGYGELSREAFTWVEALRFSRVKFVLLHVCWALILNVYYGSLVNLNELGKGIKTSTFLAGIADVTGVAIGVILIVMVDRDWLASGVMLLLCGIIGSLSWLLPEKSEMFIELLMITATVVMRTATAASYTLLVATSANIFDKFSSAAIHSFNVFAKVVLLLTPLIESLAIHSSQACVTNYGAFLTASGFFMIIFSCKHYRHRHDSILFDDG